MGLAAHGGAVWTVGEAGLELTSELNFASTLGLEGQTLGAEENVPGPLARSLEKAIRNFTSQLFGPALLVGLVLSVVGLLITLVSPLFPGRRRRRVSAAPWRV